MGEVVPFPKRQENPKFKVGDYVSFIDKDARGARSAHGNIVSIEGNLASVEINVSGGLADSILV